MFQDYSKDSLRPNENVIYVVRRRGRLAPRQPLSVCALFARLRGEQASAASWEPRPPFEATEMD